MTHLLSLENGPVELTTTGWERVCSTYLDCSELVPLSVEPVMIARGVSRSSGAHVDMRLREQRPDGAEARVIALGKSGDSSGNWKEFVVAAPAGVLRSGRWEYLLEARCAASNVGFRAITLVVAP